MQSVLEALGNNLVTSPRSKTPPSSPSLAHIKQPTRDHLYDTIPLTFPETDNSSTASQQSSTTSSSSIPAKDYIYDTIPLRNQQQFVVESGESHYAVPKPVGNSPAVSPRIRRRGSQSISQQQTVNASQSRTQSLDQRHSEYDVPRSTSRSSVPPPQSPSSQGSTSNKHQSHYDVPNPRNSTCVSPLESSPTQSPSCSSSPVSERRSHYDVPSKPILASRQPPSQFTQQCTVTTATNIVTTQESSSASQRRISHPGTPPPPVRPRPSPNVPRRLNKTLDRTSGLSMNFMSELKTRTSTMSVTGIHDS